MAQPLLVSKRYVASGHITRSFGSLNEAKDWVRAQPPGHLFEISVETKYRYGLLRTGQP